MATIYNPYTKDEWNHQGKPPSLADHKITLEYLQGRFKRGISGNPNI